MSTIDRTVGLPAAEAVEVAEPPPRERARRPRNVLGRVFTVLGLLLASAAFLYPFLWLLGASLRPRAQTFLTTPLPIPFAPENYVTIWDEVPLLLWITNSV